MDSDTLKSLNIDNTLSNFVSTMEDFLEVFKDSQSDAEKLLDTIHIEFSNLYYTEEASDLLTYIYKNWHFELNFKMIELMVSKQAPNIVADLSNLTRSNLTTVRNSGALELRGYIEDYLEEYVEDIILAQSSNSEEDEETLIYLLNKDDDKISLENRKSLINQQHVKIGNIDKITDKKLWSTLLDGEGIIANWSNVLSYFEQVAVIDRHLFDYLSKSTVLNVLKENKFNVGNTKTDVIYNKFSSGILLNDEFEETAYDVLLECNPYHYIQALNVGGLSAVKVEKLIKKEKIRLNPGQFLVIKEQFKDLVGIYVAQFIVAYLSDKESYMLIDADYISIFKTSIDNAYKIKLVADLSIDRIEANSILASYVGKVILTQTEYSLSNDLLSVIVKNGLFKQENLVLFAKYLPQVDIYLADDLMAFLNDPYKKLTLRGKQVSLPNTAFNINFINILKNKGYIKKPAFNEKEIRVYNKKQI